MFIIMLILLLLLSITVVFTTFEAAAVFFSHFRLWSWSVMWVRLWWSSAYNCCVAFV